MKKTTQLLALIFSFVLIFNSCNRSEEPIDDLPQEEVSNALLSVKDETTGLTAVYNYQINGTNIPDIKLINGREYTVQIALKNGAEDVTQEIIDAKDEHFFTFDFPNSDIVLMRLDNASSTRTDGNKLGLLTKWYVIAAEKTAAGAQMRLTLYHKSISTSETAQTTANGTVYGLQSGGETDLQVNYKISNP